MSINALMHWASANAPGFYIAAAVAALVVLALLRTGVRALRRHDLADTLTVLIALATTVYAGAGNWKFLGSAMHYGADLKAVLVCALEGAVVVEGLRSRKNIAEFGRGGADGVGLWVLAGLSSVLASSASGSLPEALGRLAIPLVAAWLWERLLAPQRRARKALREASPIRWRITPERVLVWLRLADSTDLDVSKIDAGRRVARFLRKTDREKNGRRWPFTAKASADRERLRMFRDALMRYGEPTEVYGTLATIGYGQALSRMGLTKQMSTDVDVDITTQEAAGRDVDLADLSTPEVPTLTIASQEAAINTPVLTSVKTLSNGNAKAERIDAETAEEIIRFGWEFGMSVRGTARAADRDPAQISRKFARLDAQYGPRAVRLGDGDSDALVKRVNGSI